MNALHTPIRDAIAARAPLVFARGDSARSAGHESLSAWPRQGLCHSGADGRRRAFPLGGMRDVRLPDEPIPGPQRVRDAGAS